MEQYTEANYTKVKQACLFAPINSPFLGGIGNILQ